MSSTLSVNNLLIDLTKIYRDIYQCNGAIIQCHVDYYDSISFTVLHEEDYYDITLRVGEAIDIEDTDDSDERSYALLQAIMIHQDDYERNNPFLLIDWFYRNGNIDAITGFPIYGLQKSDDTTWFHLHPLTIVDRQPRVHFVHKCINSCLKGTHSKNNMEYILNEFYYIIV